MRAGLQQTLKQAGIRFIRVLWCDNANVIRSKAAHVTALDALIDEGKGITAKKGVKKRGHCLTLYRTSE